MHSVELRVGGQIYGGFQGGHVMLSMEELAPAFELFYADRWVEVGAPLPIREGDAARLTVDDEVLIDGYIVESSDDDGPEMYELRATGQAKTVDLVDCAATRRSSQWSRVPLLTIVRDICEPFGIEVEDRVGDQTKFGTFRLRRGEGAQDAIERAARQRGGIPLSEGAKLVLARAGSDQTRTVLRRGENIKRAGRMGTWSDRYSDYIFKGQTRATDELNGRSANQLRQHVEDPALKALGRHRPLVVQSGGQDGPRDLGVRAVLERNQRAGRSERLRYTVPGWKTDEGKVWRPNTLVRVDDPWRRVDTTMIVVSARFDFDLLEESDSDGGFLTELELTRPEAFDTADYPARRDFV